MTAPLPACEWEAVTPVPVPVTVPGARLRLRALVAIGHGPARIARALGVRTHTVQRILTGATTAVPAGQLRVIRDLYEAWWDLVPPTRTKAERQTAGAARSRARREGWCTGMGLDDELLDVPGYTPQCTWRAATGTGTADDDPLAVAS
jgi:hypothetical protein